MTYLDPGLDPDVIHVCARCEAEYPSEIAAYRCCNPATPMTAKRAAHQARHAPGETP